MREGVHLPQGSMFVRIRGRRGLAEGHAEEGARNHNNILFSIIHKRDCIQ